jgi:hypothetical protein
MEATRELAHDGWSEYFDWLSKELVNAPLSIEIVAPSGQQTAESRDLALQTLAYDWRDDVFEVAGARGGPHLPSTLRRLVNHPQRVLVDSDLILAPIEIAVDGSDGVRTVIKVDREADFSG